jgi:phage terminase large subunit
VSVLDIPTARCFLPLLQPRAPDGLPVRYLGAHGGRASAKSHFFAERLVEENLCAKVDSVCIREVQKSLRFSVKRTIESKIEAHNAGAYFSVQDKIITSARGGITIFEGMQNQTADSIKSLEGFDRAFVEEAQTLSQRSLDLLDPTIRKAGSQLWFGWNPRFATDPVDVLLRGKHLPPGAIVVQANYRDNPWFPDVLRPKVEFDRRHDKDKYEHVWMGGYEQHSEARVFRRWQVEEFDSPSNATLRFGADWGFSVDPTVLVRCFIGRWEKGEAIADDHGRHLFIDAEAYEVGCDIDKTPALFDTVPDSRAWPITADSARPETISHMKRNGFPKMVAAIKGAGSIEEGVKFLQGFDIVVHPNCVSTIDELTAYKYKTDPLTGKVLPILEDKKNNVIDSLRYACEGARRAARAVKPAQHEAPVPMVSHFSRNR